MRGQLPTFFLALTSTPDALAVGRLVDDDKATEKELCATDSTLKTLGVAQKRNFSFFLFLFLFSCFTFNRMLFLPVSTKKSLKGKKKNAIHMVRADSSSLVRRAVEDEGNALQTVTASSLSSKSHFSEMDER